MVFEGFHALPVSPEDAGHDADAAGHDAENEDDVAHSTPFTLARTDRAL